jgi:hypothetical protein
MIVDKVTKSSYQKGMRAFFLVVLMAYAACQPATPATDKDSNDPSPTQAKLTEPSPLAKPAKAPAKVEDKAEPLRTDLDTFCNSQERSGSLELEEGERSMHVSLWLAGKIKSQEGRSFLAAFQKTPDKDKARLLNSTSLRLGLPSCPLANAWGG